ncbi:lasso RiPP family leader peptide-containing protein [Streptomyces hoynatensis]|uniref:Lasso RiPP family leader peptide-containing protein n=1 Tax=Streptomyces hoynatensis TaxID=1141874 RepID=A0A3A9Z9C7_9ACTN|nr:lasso RiPP family leader peptide-containing protein [Streptomyces hoynatensis]
MGEPRRTEACGAARCGGVFRIRAARAVAHSGSPRRRWCGSRSEGNHCWWRRWGAAVSERVGGTIVADSVSVTQGSVGSGGQPYEPPALVEVGEFSTLTLGWPEGNRLEEGGEGLRWWF